MRPLVLSSHLFQNLVQIDGSVLLWNNTEGLCGSLDGNPENDLSSKEGRVVKSVSVLASSWQINKIGGTGFFLK